MSDIEEKQRVLDIAAGKFLESGFNKVTIDEVATELRMSKKTLYKFFPSKEDLIHAVAKLLLSNAEREVSAIVNAEEPFEQKVTKLLTLIGKNMHRISRQFQLDIQRYAPNLWKEIETFRREKIFVRVRQMFEQAKRENIFREDLNVDLLYLVFIHTVQGIMNPKTLSENSFSAVEAFQGIVKIIYEGALTEEGRKRVNLFRTDINQQL